MGLNLSARCLDCKVEMGILRGYENVAINVFNEEHHRHHKLLQVDNGWVAIPAEEWSPGEGFEEKTFPPDWPLEKQPERYKERRL